MVFVPSTILRAHTARGAQCDAQIAVEDFIMAGVIRFQARAAIEHVVAYVKVPAPANISMNT
jgi:hypothetical protein